MISKPALSTTHGLAKCYDVNQVDKPNAVSEMYLHYRMTCKYVFTDSTNLDPSTNFHRQI